MRQWLGLCRAARQPLRGVQLMTARPLPSPESTPEKTLDQKWDEWQRYWDMNSPSDAELARQAAADPDVAPVRTAEEVRSRYKLQPPLVK